MFKAKGSKAIDNAVSSISKAVDTLEALSMEEDEACSSCASEIRILRDKSMIHRTAANRAKSIASKLKELVA